jgi:pyridoxal phosphate enzyme (YggS family)
MISSDDIKRNIEVILKKISAKDRGVKLLAVTKTFSIDAIEAAIGAGLNEFGESKVQEAESKVPVINSRHKNIYWHFIGHLQTNKAGRALKLFNMIQSVDSLKLAGRISGSAENGARAGILVEVKTSGEDAKFGVAPEKVSGLIRDMAGLPGIKIMGLMTMAPYSGNPEDARPYFKKARALFDELKKNTPANAAMEILSMGMSGDYLVAIEEGSTMVRIGMAIFGERQIK